MDGIVYAGRRIGGNKITGLWAENDKLSADPIGYHHDKPLHSPLHIISNHRRSFYHQLAFVNAGPR
ncbi:hypothetical protein BCON_0079g00250 [Botryotinia convoluta]|uniref:Uncharacterized protein n=1 Tax=Botryotinia convoluta TaxID=54673 RepID=A0A4Z1I409_9HELO|nr:hypothetical protein BCON_0079g00250 [Botryotinia convoluta]